MTTATQPTTPQHAQRFEQVYAALQPVVLRLARRQLTLAGSGARAGVYGVAGVSPEDIAQQTWLQVWRHWPALDGRPMQSVTSYVLRTAQHLVIDHQRRRVLRGRMGEVALTADLWEIVNETVASPARETQPEAVTLDAALVVEARAALTHLHGRHVGQAAALFDAMLLDEPRAQTAARLRMTEGTVKTGQWRIRQTLRQQMGEQIVTANTTTNMATDSTTDNEVA